MKNDEEKKKESMCLILLMGAEAKLAAIFLSLAW